MRSVENEECGKCRVLKKNIEKGNKKDKRKNTLRNSPAPLCGPWKSKLLLTK